MTYSERFFKESFIIEPDKNGNPRKAYLLVRNVTDTDGNNPLSLLFPGADKHHKWDPETHMLSFECRVRFANALKSCEDNLPRLFIILNQLFTEDAIRKYFSDIWVAHNNVKVRKINTTELQQLQRAKKLGLIKPDPDHREIVRSTRNMSIREAAKRSRNF